MNTKFFGLPPRICLRGECHKCHNCHIENEKFKKHTTIQTTIRFFKEIEIQTPYLYGLNQVYSSLDRVSINIGYNNLELSCFS